MPRSCGCGEGFGRTMCSSSTGLSWQTMRHTRHMYDVIPDWPAFAWGGDAVYLLPLAETRLRPPVLLLLLRALGDAAVDARVLASARATAVLPRGLLRQVAGRDGRQQLGAGGVQH